MMTHGSLFSGIGGFDLASEWMGWDNLFHCEWEAFPRTVLKHHFPNSESYGDIKETDFTIWRGKIDILTGGFPCQPYSAAGKRLGKQDERHLFPEMLRAVREIEPRWVVGENVRGLVSWNGGLVFEEVQADLEAEGYEVQPFLLPAASVNAPHKRDRIWFVAFKNSNKNGWRSVEWKEESNQRKFRNIGAGDNEQLSSNNEKNRISTNPSSVRRRGGNIGSETNKEQGHEMGESFGQHRNGIWSEAQRRSSNATDTNSEVSQHGNQGRKTQGATISKERTQSFGSPRSWQKFPTQSPVCGGNDGIPRELDAITFPKWRKESIKAYGNAIVPQVALQIFKAINLYEQGTTKI